MKMPNKSKASKLSTKKNSVNSSIVFGRIDIEFCMLNGAKMVKTKHNNADCLLIEVLHGHLGKYPTKVFLCVNAKSDAFKHLLITMNKKTPFNSVVISGNADSVRVAQMLVPNNNFVMSSDKGKSVKVLETESKVSLSHVLFVTHNAIKPSLTYTSKSDGALSIDVLSNLLPESDKVLKGGVINSIVTSVSLSNKVNELTDTVDIGFNKNKEVFIAELHGDVPVPFVIFDSEERKRSTAFFKDNNEQLCECSLFPMPLMHGGVVFYFNIMSWEKRNNIQVIDTDVSDVMSSVIEDNSENIPSSDEEIFNDVLNSVDF